MPLHGLPSRRLHSRCGGVVFRGASRFAYWSSPLRSVHAYPSTWAGRVRGHGHSLRNRGTTGKLRPVPLGVDAAFAPPLRVAVASSRVAVSARSAHHQRGQPVPMSVPILSGAPTLETFELANQFSPVALVRGVISPPLAPIPSISDRGWIGHSEARTATPSALGGLGRFGGAEDRRYSSIP